MSKKRTNATIKPFSPLLDWTDRTLYPKSDTALSDDEWRWEFTRRSKEYRQGWQSKKSEYPSRFGMREWIDPASSEPPEFLRDGGYFLKFDKSDPTEIVWEYYALASSAPMTGVFYFAFDTRQSLKQQIKMVTDRYKEIETKGEKIPTRKNNKAAKKSRSRSYLLRVLDAARAGVSPGDIANLLHGEMDGGDNISETAMRRTIEFAESFWQRL